MSAQEAVARLLTHPQALIILAVLLFVGCLILAVLLFRAVRVAHRARHTSQENGGPTVDDVLTVIADAQDVLSTTAKNLESDRERLERLRLEAAVRRRGAIP
jgi:hypothetical protein